MPADAIAAHILPLMSLVMPFATRTDMAIAIALAIAIVIGVVASGIVTGAAACCTVIVAGAGITARS